MRDSIYIGSVPPEEDCAQVGSEDYDYYLLAKAECKLYIEVLREHFGREPVGARLFVKSHPHDFGTYYAVECEFQSDLPDSVDFAFKCEGEGPMEWPKWAHTMITRFKKLCIHNHEKAVELSPSVKKRFAVPSATDEPGAITSPILAWDPNLTEQEFNDIFNIPS